MLRWTVSTVSMGRDTAMHSRTRSMNVIMLVHRWIAGTLTYSPSTQLTNPCLGHSKDASMHPL